MATKIRVLYPTAFANLPHPPEAGDTITIDDAEAKRFIDAGYAEAVGRQAPVEQATAAPGEKRTTARKRTSTKAAT